MTQQKFKKGVRSFRNDDFGADGRLKSDLKDKKIIEDEAKKRTEGFLKTPVNEPTATEATIEDTLEKSAATGTVTREQIPKTDPIKPESEKATEDAKKSK